MFPARWFVMFDNSVMGASLPFTVTAIADGSVVFQAGPGALIEWFVNGGTPDAPSELCAALASAE